MSIFRSILSALQSEVPLPQVLTREISLTSFSAPNTGKRKRSTAKRANTGRAVAHFSLEGPLQSGKSTSFAIESQDLVITPDTWIFGELRVGAQAKVKGVYANGSDRVCSSIVLSSNS